jgi:hypothetical protein
MSPSPAAGRRGLPPWPKDALRIAVGIIWLIDAVLKWLPGFRSTYMDTIMPADAAGERHGCGGKISAFMAAPLVAGTAGLLEARRRR